MKNNNINTFIFIVMILVVVLTLMPLFLMFKASLKAEGTLTKTISEINIADFNEGLESALNQPILTLDESAKDKANVELISERAGEDDVLSARIKKTAGPVVFVRTQIDQDVRKFKQLEFDIMTGGAEPVIAAGLEDAFGQITKVDIDGYYGSRQAGLSRLIIPLANFDLGRIEPKNVEYLVFEAEADENCAVYLDNITFKLKKITFINYIDVLVSGPFGRYFFNSALIAFVVTLGNLIFSTMVGYVFARRDFPFKQTFFLLIVGSIMIPPQVLAVPVFILMKNIGWLNTYWALTVPSLVLPFNVFLMRQYISGLPIDIEDAALVDGANMGQILFKIIMPLARPALAVVGINTFMGAWNTFLYPFLLTNTSQMRTLPVGLALYKSLYSVDWVHLMAASSITAIPVIIVFLMFQKHIIASLTKGAVKG